MFSFLFLLLGLVLRFFPLLHQGSFLIVQSTVFALPNGILDGFHHGKSVSETTRKRIMKSWVSIITH